MKIKPFILYSSDGCHLCEQALELILQQITADEIEIVDIVDDEKLVELYGVHIPVLERIDTGTKLFWPFSSDELANLFSK
ncbi:MAG: glutaredoxin family protein [Alteromonadaceae bacterium]|nr:glutaredoxin family protein [Alteromonadaceae bacterium]